ncbi:MAG: hypothetical protein OXL97_05380 [Chloroflexota bacterium]|nr:hypothetical protein [Chloroflexota bacterium]MDE2883990.1 hypothetical protein [Chloroflexota bacterium]
MRESHKQAWIAVAIIVGILGLLWVLDDREDRGWERGYFQGISEGFEYGYGFGSYSECVRKAAYPGARFTRDDCRLFEEHWEHFDEVLRRSDAGIPSPWEGGPPYRHPHPLARR